MKRCNTCGVAKKSTAFTKQKQRSGNFALMFECKECACIKQTKRHQKQTPEQKLRKKETFILRTYGITMREYNSLFEKQEGKCASCKIHQSELLKALVIDHCHKTMKVRGLLCAGCNLALGNVKESYDSLIALAAYVKAAA